ncbi:hypothetical protein BH10ACT9_BH10ACT9_46000 [soil metagenome]
MGRRDVARCTVEYGIISATSRTILTVTEDYAEAEHTLDLIGEGRLVRRTVTYSAWADIPVSQSTSQPSPA